jgi:dipeptidyl aminopeptidase/acylaminoacyl peptidase
MSLRSLAVLSLLLWMAPCAVAGELRPLQPEDLFGIEYARDPRISPDGSQVVYVRTSMDVMTDHKRSNLWIVAADGSDHRPLLSGQGSYHAPRWSPDGTRLAYVTSVEGSSQIYVRWMDTGQTARVTDLTESPGSVTWSPDGTELAFTMFVPAEAPTLGSLPDKPEGAEWAEPARIIDDVFYRHDGGGLAEVGFHQLFVVPADGGTPRQLTDADQHHRGPLAWTPDGAEIVLSSHRRDDWELSPRDTELFAIGVADGAVRQLTDRRGPDDGPAVSPDGRWLAWTGFDDRKQGFQITKIHVAPLAGGEPRVLADDLDRSVRQLRWRPDGKGICFMFLDEGAMHLASVTLDGKVERLATGIGGTYIGRPYATGSYTLGARGRFATVVTDPGRPADVAVGGPRGGLRQLTQLNDDLLSHRDLAPVEEIRYASSHDGREIQGWVVKPPGFDPAQTYPLILEIHGGPFAMYGPGFAVEMQLYAAAGYVVLYVNPRGSTGYGEEFGNLIHHDYPGHDVHDLLSGVDAVVAQGFVDPDQLFVTGGSGGGVLTAWIVGVDHRFAAAASVKPIINWHSFTLTTDFYPQVVNYWWPGPPWESPDHYWDHSPLALAGEVQTPTLLMAGEQDYRTPISEVEQFYQALKLRQVDTVMVRIPDTSHGISARPSNQLAKVAHILAWFERYRP